jgi:cytochrome c2
MNHYRLGLVILAVVSLGWLYFNPPRFWLNLTKSVEPTVAVGAQRVEQYGCRNCHKIGNEGALKAPNLTDITQRINDPAQVTLRLWLQNPVAVKGNTAMPNFHLSDSEIEAILLYLVELDNQLKNN